MMIYGKLNSKGMTTKEIDNQKFLVLNTTTYGVLTLYQISECSVDKF